MGPTILESCYKEKVARAAEDYIVPWITISFQCFPQPSGKHHTRKTTASFSARVANGLKVYTSTQESTFSAVVENT